MMMVSLLLLAAAPEVGALLVGYRTLTRADVECSNPNPGEDIMVCGARKADRFRVPFVNYDIGDPRAESIEAERERLQYRTTPCQDRGPFLIGCGSVGVRAHARFGADGITEPSLRPLAR